MHEQHKKELSRVLQAHPECGKIIATSLSGSYLYGTNNEDSDLDVRGVYVLPKEKFLLFHEPKLEFVPEGFDDVKFFEVKKFLYLCTKGNPHQLELLFSKPIASSYEWSNIYSNRGCLLGKRSILEAYRGFMKQEFFASMKDENTTRKYKRLGHIFRLSIQAQELLTYGEMDVRLNDFNIEVYKLIRSGHYTSQELEKVVPEFIKNVEEAYNQSKLPDEANYEEATKLLLNVRNNVYLK